MENCVGGTSQLKKPSVAGGVTVLSEGLVGRGVTEALVDLVSFVGLIIFLEAGFEVLAFVDFETVDFDGLTLDNVGFGVVIWTEFDLDLGGVALDEGTLGLGVIFLTGVNCGLFETAAWSSMRESCLVLRGFIVIVAGVVGFFFSGSAVVFLEGLTFFCGVGFGVVGLEVFWLEALGLGVGGFVRAVGDAVVLSGAVTVLVLVLGDGATKPNWDVTGVI